MNALAKARSAYSSASAPTRTPKSVEYDAVARITARLQQAATQEGENFPAIVAALHDNTRLWSVFATSVADKDNALPDDLKARLFYLAEFTRVHTARVLEKKANVTPLLEINASILRGLRGEAA